MRQYHGTSTWHTETAHLMTRKGHSLTGVSCLLQGHSFRDLETSHCGQVSGLTSQSVLPPNSTSWGRSFCHMALDESLCFKQWYLAMVETRIQICSSPHSKSPPDTVRVMVVVGSRGKGSGWSPETVVWQKRRSLKAKAISSPYSVLVEHTQSGWELFTAVAEDWEIRVGTS